MYQKNYILLLSHKMLIVKITMIRKQYEIERWKQPILATLKTFYELILTYKRYYEQKCEDYKTNK